MQEYHKLIRDRIPEIIAQDGKQYSVRILDEHAYKRALLEKLVEEAREVLATDGEPKELTKEIGDVEEVIRAIVDAYGLGRSEVDRVREERLGRRGGFAQRIFLETVED